MGVLSLRTFSDIFKVEDILYESFTFKNILYDSF